MVVEYVRALMQKRLVCRSGEERRQLAQQMLQDDQLFREIFHSLVGIKYCYTILLHMIQKTVPGYVTLNNISMLRLRLCRNMSTTLLILQ